MPSEKATLQKHLDTQDRNAGNTPRDLPPAYENTLIPTTNNTVSTPSISTPQPPQVPVPTQNPLTSLSRLSKLPFGNYIPRDAKLSDDHTSLTTSKPELLSTQYALAKFIREQAALPPKPLMVVKGTHTGGSGTVVDFEFTCNLMPLLDIDSSSSTVSNSNESPLGGRTRVMAFQPPSQGSSSPSSKRRSFSFRSNTAAADDSNPLDAWIRKFTSSSGEDAKSESRTFTLTRMAPSLPRGILEGHVRTLIATTKYRGKVTVEFPMLYKEVHIQRQAGNWFTNLLRMTTTKNFEVVESVWGVGGAGFGEDQLFAGEGGSGSGSGSGSSANHEQSDTNGRAGLVAQEWWKEWQTSIWNAVLSGRKGWVTVEDWMEAKIGIRQGGKGRDWGVDYQS